MYGRLELDVYELTPAEKATYASGVWLRATKGRPECTQSSPFPLGSRSDASPR